MGDPGDDSARLELRRCQVKATLYAFLSLFMIVAGLACERSSTMGSAGKKLSIIKPSDQTLKRGEVNDLAISINRDNFSSPVKVKFQRLPKGVEVVEPRDIPADQTRIVYTLHAANDADLVENYEAMVTAEGPDGMATTETFRVSVRDKT
jgi:hypothetical protein